MTFSQEIAEASTEDNTGQKMEKDKEIQKLPASQAMEQFSTREKSHGRPGNRTWDLPVSSENVNIEPNCQTYLIFFSPG